MYAVPCDFLLHSSESDIICTMVLLLFLTSPYKIWHFNSAQQTFCRKSSTIDVGLISLAISSITRPSKYPKAIPYQFFLILRSIRKLTDRLQSTLRWDRSELTIFIGLNVLHPSSSSEKVCFSFSERLSDQCGHARDSKNPLQLHHTSSIHPVSSSRSNPCVWSMRGVHSSIHRSRVYISWRIGCCMMMTWSLLWCDKLRLRWGSLLIYIGHELHRSEVIHGR